MRAITPTPGAVVRNEEQTIGRLKGVPQCDDVVVPQPRHDRLLGHRVLHLVVVGEEAFRVHLYMCSAGGMGTGVNGVMVREEVDDDNSGKVWG